MPLPLPLPGSFRGDSAAFSPVAGRRNRARMPRSYGIFCGGPNGTRSHLQNPSARYHCALTFKPSVPAPPPQPHARPRKNRRGTTSQLGTTHHRQPATAVLTSYPPSNRYILIPTASPGAPRGAECLRVPGVHPVEASPKAPRTRLARVSVPSPQRHEYGKCSCSPSSAKSLPRITWRSVSRLYAEYSSGPPT